MARHIVTSVVDDLDASPADETVLFSLDGLSYEIDLSISNAAALRRLLAPYAAKARPREPAAGRDAGWRTAAERRRTTAIRRWALAEGMQVTARGRLPAQVTERYLRRHD
ncbi:Lsr2 family protein [Pseudonocardia sp. N23]|uniref:histone-like nucleoid-structuring protein Lsr2 n=1 Tax=Pseudonocardia sp. N23 TaxID=1987376 RepID=UPI000BFE06F4|nr:Lsr2 family protein [Pseudonocardia sp. N23]GAY12604.1 histone protein Lsr2 [Pseudonocardia sp. N23]